VVLDEDDDDVEETKPKKSTPVKRRKTTEEPKEEETTSSAYFDSKKAKNGKASTNGSVHTPKKTAQKELHTPASGRRSARKGAKVTYAEEADEDEDEDGTAMKVDDDKDGGDDDVHADDYKIGRKADDYDEGSDDDDIPLKPTKRTAEKKNYKDEEDSDLEMVEVAALDGASDSKKKKSTPKTSKKRKAEEDEDEEEDEEDPTPKKKRKSTSTTTRKPRAKKEVEPENSEVAQVLASIKTVRAPTPPPKDETRKFQFGGGNAAVAPANAGAKELPVGAENCLAGMAFVFTGVLETLGREEGQNLVKRYGGKVTSGPSSKTNFVVLGAEAGPKKLETIQKLNLKTIDEDGLFQIIRSMPANGGDSKAAAQHAEKKAKAEEATKKEAADMEKKEKERQKQAEKEAKASAAARGLAVPDKPKGLKIDDRLWVDKYAPDHMAAVCGNKSLVEKLQNWLRNWPSRQKHNFKQAGADGNGIFRAAMLHGPPGIGKTTAAHLVAKLEGYDVVESNASDTRSKKLVETGLKGVLDTTSLLGYFAGDGKKVDESKKKLLLIMDEVDGMSAGDRGGVGAMAAVAKKTQVPMILICNDRKLQKMKPFDFVCADFPFRRPTTDMIRSRIMTICYREGLKLPTPVIDAIIEGSHADIRQIINMISTIKLDNKQLDHGEGKAMSKAWEKHVILKPWDVVNKILRPEMFTNASTATLNDKIELYFNDHEFSYLMLQENYLKTKMARATGYNGKEHALKLLEMADNAASSISDGDLVDRMIHGSQQQWSLMPTHAVFSFVRPASYVYGNFGGQVGFTSWLGNNSKQGKLTRYIKDIQGHMRVRASGDRHEIRQQYLPAIWNKTVKALMDKGRDVTQEVIDFLDSYYLTKDDYDAIVELGLGPMDQEKVKIETATKAQFTRLYNAQTHHASYQKASTIGSTLAKTGGGKRDKPDLEEAIEDSEEDVVGMADEGLDGDDDEELDLKKDKFIKAPKKKAAPKAKAEGGARGKGKGKGKRVKDEDEDEDDEEEEEEPKPKKRAATGATRGRGRGRGKG